MKKASFLINDFPESSVKYTRHQGYANYYYEIVYYFIKNDLFQHIFKAVAILPSTTFYPWRLFCRELFVIGQL